MEWCKIYHFNFFEEVLNTVHLSILTFSPNVAFMLIKAEYNKFKKKSKKKKEIAKTCCTDFIKRIPYFVFY